jgi:hypothetical protein
VQWKQKRFRRGRIGWRAALAAVAACLAAGQPPALAEDAPPAPTVGLDQLLKSPNSLVLEPTTRGQSTKAEWRSRFQEAREELATSRAALAKTQEKLTEVAGGSSAWKMGAPGFSGIDPGSNKDTPLDYSLSSEMRRNREEVERAERRLTELEIEANLASVPEDWRGPEAPDEPEAAQALE